MSLVVVHIRALVGLAASEVRVEVHVGNGLPAFHIVGQQVHFAVGASAGPWTLASRIARLPSRIAG